eukprot:scaffold96062_cov24-Tisochrysis_lutea.AAC.1
MLDAVPPGHEDSRVMPIAAAASRPAYLRAASGIGRSGFAAEGSQWMRCQQRLLHQACKPAHQAMPDFGVSVRLLTSFLESNTAKESKLTEGLCGVGIMPAEEPLQTLRG